MSELLLKLRKEKFGHLSEEGDMNFSGMSDPTDAPHDFKVSVGGSEFLIQGIMGADEDEVNFVLLIQLRLTWALNYLEYTCNYGGGHCNPDRAGGH